MGMTYSVDGKTAETGTMNLTNLTPENIRAGVNINGVTGNYIPRLKSKRISLLSFRGNLYNHGETYTITDLPKGVISVKCLGEWFVESNGQTSDYGYSEDHGIINIAKIYPYLCIGNSHIDVPLFPLHTDMYRMGSGFTKGYSKTRVKEVSLNDRYAMISSYFSRFYHNNRFYEYDKLNEYYHFSLHTSNDELAKLSISAPSLYLKYFRYVDLKTEISGYRVEANDERVSKNIYFEINSCILEILYIE